MKSRQASRRRSRGAVYTELLAIMPSFVIVNMALLHLSGAYASAESAMRSARAGAWAPAMTGCDGKSPSTSGDAHARATSPAADSSLEPLSPRIRRVLPNAGSPALRAPLQSLALRNSGAETSSHSTSASNDFALFEGADFKRSSTVTCNEVPRAIKDVDEKSAVDDAWKRFVQ